MKRLEFELTESGQGPAVLMLPGSFATPAAWKGVQKGMKSPTRTLSTSLPGYGTTPEIRTDKNADISLMIEFVGQVVEAVGEPVHIVGHSWGAQIVLAAVLAKRVDPLSVVCFEANPIFAQPANGRFPWRTDIEAMVERFEEALVAGNPEAASIIIDFYSREGTFLGMSENVRAFCRSTATTNLRDWRSAATFTPFFEAFADVDLPITLVRGGATPVPIIDVTEHLVASIPGASEKVVEGADHFLISTHPAVCAEILEAHISNVEG